MDTWKWLGGITEWRHRRELSHHFYRHRYQPKADKIIWKLGAPILSGQNAPLPLPNGKLLIFDNGPHRVDHPMPYSRVIEVEMVTKQIVWKYQENRESDFFSPRVSNAQRLPNGNTLICEGDFGRLFEVTSDGELVWEYVNPYFGGPPNAQNNQVFRAYRYSAEEIARAKGQDKPMKKLKTGLGRNRRNSEYPTTEEEAPPLWFVGRQKRW